MITIDNLNSLNNLIDEELNLYEKLRDFYAEKKKVLISSRISELYSIDDEILRLVDEIKSSVNHRRILCKGFSNENICLSELEECANSLDSDLAKEFRVKKERTKILLTEIDKYEKISRELIKHGMNIVNKTLNLISDNTSLPVAGEYNNTGKSTQNGLLKMSSVIEEV